MKFIDKIISRIEEIDSNVCVGLDSRYDRIPDFIKKGKGVAESILAFNQEVVKASVDVAVCYKSNVAFYSGFGADGLEGLRLTNEWIKKEHPSVPLIADCKRSEMGESVGMVKREIFEWLGFDCVMATPWFGFDTVREYLDDETKGVSIYVHDSNPTAVEFQDLVLKDGRRVYEVVAQKLAKEWNTNGNVIVEAGATYPIQLSRIREIVGEEMVILTAGIGVQGAKAQDLNPKWFGKNGQRMIVNSSRGIIFPGDGKKDYFNEVRKAAISLRDDLRKLRAA